MASHRKYNGHFRIFDNNTRQNMRKYKKQMNKIYKKCRKISNTKITKYLLLKKSKT